MSEALKEEMRNWLYYSEAHPDNWRTQEWAYDLLHNIAIELHLEDGN